MIREPPAPKMRLEETLALTPALSPRRAERVPHLRGWTPWARNLLEGIARGSGCFLGGKGRRQGPLSRRDILARRFKAGTGVWTFMSPNGAPTQSPTLSRDCGTTLGWRANTTQPQRGCGYIHARVDHYWSFGFHHMRSNRAMGRNPVGVDISFVPSTQGRRGAPTLGSVSERRWRSELSNVPDTGLPTFWRQNPALN